MGTRIDVEILSRGTWRAGFTLVAERMQSGRIFLGGDAAHLFTPAGGLGYNTAIEDAVNLGWKLAAVVRGSAPHSLLASYEQERRPAAVRNTNYARQFAESLGANAAPATEIKQAFAASGLELKVLDIPGETARDLYETDLALIRPDQVVAFRGREIRDPRALTARVSGRVQAETDPEPVQG